MRGRHPKHEFDITGVSMSNAGASCRVPANCSLMMMIVSQVSGGKTKRIKANKSSRRPQQKCCNDLPYHCVLSRLYFYTFLYTAFTMHQMKLNVDLPMQPAILAWMHFT